MNTKKIILIVVGVFLLIGLSIGAYFLAIEVDKVHENNMKGLEGFGSVVTPGTTKFEEDGQTGMAPSIGVTKVSTTDKIIISLSQEKEDLLDELEEANATIADLKRQVALLINYKETNERYAPRLMTEERDFALNTIAKYLESSKDAERFNQFQKDAMVQQSANMYLDLVRRFHLNITDGQREELLTSHLPAYAFCFGDSIGFVANTSKEETRLLKYLESLDKSLISENLQHDIESINIPCLSALNERVQKLFRSDLR